MLLNILKKDFLRKKSITFSLFIFMSLSALLVASGSNMIVELSNSLNSLFAKSNAPHFVQMHAGEVDQADIDAFAASHHLVDDHQIVEMIPIDGLNIDFGGSGQAIQNSVMDHYFMKQNHSFDFLLNLDSQMIQLSKGEIAVPIYYMQQYNLKQGDKITIATPSFQTEFTIVDFVRDVQMNPSIIHSKRFVIHEFDLEIIKKNFGEVEYLIEFLLADLSTLSEFRNDYESSNLPRKGPNIDYHLFKTLNAITDGIVAAVVILVSVLLSLIAILCIRFTILAVMEEDYREIGVMKAIGIGQRDISRIYLLKYIVMGTLASVTGYVASLFLNPLFTANILLYIGSSPKRLLLQAVPVLAVILVFFVVIFICIATLRRFNKISAVEALRSGNMGETNSAIKYLTLGKSKRLNVPLFLGLRDIVGRFKMYRILLLVFFVCSLIFIVPLNFMNTLQSPNFINYMGVERSDIRIDVQQIDSRQYSDMITYISNDPDVERFSPQVTSQFKIVNSDGVLENITVESGDYSVFPLEYFRGAAPIRDNEIALSYLNGKELEKGVGDRLKLVIQGEEKEMVVSGIYQDVTNGGRTAKALLPYNAESVLWYEVGLSVKSHISINEKVKEYAGLFHPAKVTDLQGYLTQTFGNTIKQVKLFTMAAFVIALCVAILITALFLKMLMAKDDAQIAIKKSIGFSSNDIRMQYITSALSALGIGIIIGTIISNTLGQSLVSALLSFMGAAQISFVIDPVQAYILCPLILMGIVAITTIWSTASIEKSSIAGMNAD